MANAATSEQSITTQEYHLLDTRALVVVLVAVDDGCPPRKMPLDGAPKLYHARAERLNIPIPPMASYTLLAHYRTLHFIFVPFLCLHL